ncbi:MAG TPA: SusC/RagA family TonB-linked outer membrane protein [Chryseolinea sp.]|nr:SusC/RagA family TonB-linked outer membrane protein [Chryseolinea sp.]
MSVNFYLRKCCRVTGQWALLTAMLLLCQLSANAQTVKVAGQVTDGPDGNGLPGVNVSIKGTQLGTISDADGKYSLDADGNATLVFSFIGYTAQEVSVNGRSTIDVPLVASAEQLNEVVVTALGIERDERTLGYSIAKVKGEDLTHVAQENVLNSLAGRVPGVTINSTGGAGSSVQVTIRGAKSLVNGNQPLFVVDGVPMNNSLNNIGQVGSDNRVDYGNAISDINPENIESISVLKGASAAALYGSRAGNGVIIITTKSGKNAKGMTVNVSSNTVFEVPYRYLDMHHKFASGYLPFTPDNYPGGTLEIDETSVGGVGSELDKGYNAIQWNSPTDADGNRTATPLVSYKDNIKNFVNTGVTSTNDVSISNSTDLVNYRLSYTNMSNKGVIPGSDLYRNGVDLNTSIKVHPKLRLATNVNFTRTNSNNRPATNRGANPMQWAYAVSPHINIMELRDYWNVEGLQQKTQDDNAGEYNNPWFLAYEVRNAFVRDRVYGNMKADWKITPELTLMGRYSLDTYTETRETKLPTSYTNQERGGYGIQDIRNTERNIDFLLSYEKNLSSFHVNASVGGNNRFNKSTDSYTRTKSGGGLTVPNVFNVRNIAPTDVEYGSYLGQKAVYSVYGMVNLGFKDFVFLDLTARNDWSSTLPEENRSFFYPSGTISFLLNEAFNMPAAISQLKVRGGIAKVGNDTNPYNLVPVMDVQEAWGGTPRLSQSSTILLPNLKPEMSTAYEGGLDFNLFTNKVRFGATYYYVENRNQILNNLIPPSSGFDRLNFNAGLVVSKGLELTLGVTPIDKNGFRWDANLNFTKNITSIEELAPGQDRFTFWTDAKGGAWTYVGDRIGDIYDNKLITVEDKNSPYYGYPLLNEDGSWQSTAAIDAKNKIGNFNPDFIMGMQTSLSYKRFTLSLSFDWRSGGDFVSQTYRYSESDLKSQRFLDNLINPGGRSGDDLRNYLVANADNLIRENGNNFNIVGGPTEEYGGFPFEAYGTTFPYGVFNPGVIAEYDDEGNITGYVENLGAAGTKIIPYGDNYPWDFTKAATFDASFVKLREVSLGYSIPSSLTQKIGLRNASFSVYSRNIMLWTAAKIGVDPETAYQQETGAQGGGIQFKQGIERYNVNPWTIPVGFKLSFTF